MNLFIQAIISRLDGIADYIVGRRSLHLEELIVMWDSFIQQDTYLTSQIYAGMKSRIDASMPSYIEVILSQIIFFQSGKIKFSDYLKRRKDIKDNISGYNEAFIQNRLAIFNDFFDQLKLSGEQRRAVIVDDNHNLLVASAGSGKTRVLITRIMYLLSRNDKIPQEKILALAYNRKACDEIKQRLKIEGGISGIQVETFHSFGKKIIAEENKKAAIMDEEKARKEISKLFDENMKSNSMFQQTYLAYLGNYKPYEKPEEDFKTKEEYYQYRRTLEYITLHGEKVKSIGEREIANFLFEHNIPYEYERLERWDQDMPYHPDFYLPLHKVYIEHWGVNRKYKVPDWFSVSSDEYMEIRKKKLQSYVKNRKRLIETWDYERQEGTLLVLLGQRVQEILPDIKLMKLSYKELVEKVNHLTKANQRVRHLIENLIKYAKSSFQTPSDIEYSLSSGAFEGRVLLFGRIFLIIYKQYEEILKCTNQIDFNDMINKAITYVQDNQPRYINRYSAILVDEYQDISKQRYLLLSCFVNSSSLTKLFCVGDDWQSIYGFSGSNIDLFIHFEKTFTSPATNYLTMNYRSVKAIVDVSSILIQKNKNQLTKQVNALNIGNLLPRLYTIRKSVSEKQAIQFQIRHMLEQIIKLLKEGVDPGEIMILSRFNNLLLQCKGEIEKMAKQYSGLNSILMLTIHRSKGLEAQYVFILNVVTGMYGFPSEYEDDEILSLVKPIDLKKTDPYEEERRLFYVAITRAEEYLYIYTCEERKSLFVKEISGYIEEEFL